MFCVVLFIVHASQSFAPSARNRVKFIFPTTMRPQTFTASDHLPGASDLGASRRRPDIMQTVGRQKNTSRGARFEAPQAHPAPVRAVKFGAKHRICAGGIHFHRAFQSKGLPRGHRPRGNCKAQRPPPAELRSVRRSRRERVRSVSEHISRRRASALRSLAPLCASEACGSEDV